MESQGKVQEADDGAYGDQFSLSKRQPFFPTPLTDESLLFINRRKQLPFGIFSQLKWTQQSVVSPSSQSISALAQEEATIPPGPQKSSAETPQTLNILLEAQAVKLKKYEDTQYF